MRLQTDLKFKIKVNLCSLNYIRPYSVIFTSLEIIIIIIYWFTNKQCNTNKF